MPRGRPPAIPSEKDAEFIKLWNMNVLAKTLAHKYGVTVQSVYNHAVRHKLKRRRPKGSRYKNSYLVKLNDELQGTIRRRSLEMGMYGTDYVRQLIRDDALKNPPRN